MQYIKILAHDLNFSLFFLLLQALGGGLQVDHLSLFGPVELVLYLDDFCVLACPYLLGPIGVTSVQLLEELLLGLL